MNNIKNSFRGITSLVAVLLMVFGALPVFASLPGTPPGPPPNPQLQNLIVGDIDFLYTGPTGEEGKLMFSPMQRFFRVGSILGNEWQGTNLGDRSMALGFAEPAYSVSGPIASGTGSIALGTGSVASGLYANTFGLGTIARSLFETALGVFTTDYTPSNTNSDRVFTIGRGTSSADRHDALTILKDGRLGIGFDNFETTTSSAKFQVNGNIQQTAAVNCPLAANVLGIIGCDTAMVASGNFNPIFYEESVGSGTPAIATGNSSVAVGYAAHATGNYSTAIGENSTASGVYATTLGMNAQASGPASTAFKNGYAVGSNSFAYQGTAEGSSSMILATGFGITTARSVSETVMGSNSTDYTALGGTNNWNLLDRLFTIGNGFATNSDAFSILKNGQTGIAINNFETNTNGNIFQVGDGTTNIIGYVDNGTGNWVNVSDKNKKHNIKELAYGLDTINKLRPVSFDYNRNNVSTIGFLAQEAKEIIPESVFGNENQGYGMSYQVMVPAIVKAVQQLDAKVNAIAQEKGITFGDLSEMVVGTLRAKNQICIDDVCMNRDDLKALIQMAHNVSSAPAPVVAPAPAPTVVPDEAPAEKPEEVIPVTDISL